MGGSMKLEAVARVAEVVPPARRLPGRGAPGRVGALLAQVPAPTSRGRPRRVFISDYWGTEASPRVFPECHP